MCETEETNGWVVSGFEVLERQNARDVSKARKERHSRPIERASTPENARKKASTARFLDDRIHPPCSSSSTTSSLFTRAREKIPRIKHRPGTHTKKKERENRNAHQKRRTPARYLSRNYFPWLKTCSFVRSTRLKRERNVAGTNKISGGKRWWCLFFVCPVGVAKVGAFPFFLQRKDKERRGGETLNPTRPTKERKKALLQNAEWH